jgi:hypothetical protein
MFALVFALTYPTREYFAQRAQIDKLREQTEEQRKRVAALQEQRARWNDPAYVTAQARQRLHLVKPGETGFVAVPPPSRRQEPGQQAQKGQQKRPGATATPEHKTWFRDLADSVQGAGAERTPSGPPTFAPQPEAP